MAASVAGSASRLEIGVLHRSVDAAVERDAEEIGQAEVGAARAELVEQRRGERREHAAAARGVGADGFALRG